MSYPRKPGDTYTARMIGTYPELPDFPFDTKESNPTFYHEKDFDDRGNQTMRYGGPRGEVVVTLLDGVFVHARPDGTVLRRAEWNAATSDWDVTTQASWMAAHDVYTHRDGLICVLVEDGTWFIPYDAGGEGYACERMHGPPVPPVIREALQFLTSLARDDDSTSLRTTADEIDAWLSTQTPKE